MKRYKDMSILELKCLLARTKKDRAEMRMRVSGNPNLSAYDKQIEECEKELAKRNTKDGNNGQVR